MLINGVKAQGQAEDGYCILSLKDGDKVEVSFGMEPVVYCANPHVTEDCAKVSVVRGPIVYCAEEIDNGPLLQDFRMDPAMPVQVQDSDLFGGISTVKVQGTRTANAMTVEKLYTPFQQVKREPASMTLIPNYLWNNRGEGEMTVWMNSMGG